VRHLDAGAALEELATDVPDGAVGRRGHVDLAGLAFAASTRSFSVL
jgi:hypothetical protein